MLKTFKYEMNLNDEQRVHLNQNMGCARFVYNWALAKRIDYYERTGQTLQINALSRRLTLLKRFPKFNWLQEADGQSLKEVLRNLDNAYKNFFQQTQGYPKFKKKTSTASCKFNRNIYVDFENKKIKLPKIGWCKIRIDREFIGDIRFVVVKKLACGKYFVNILVDIDVSVKSKQKVQTKTAIGIDLGVKFFVVCSNGEKIENPNILKQNEGRLKKLHHSFDRKKFNSKNKEKARRKLARLYYKIKCQRTDFLQKLTSRLISENQTIFLEDLNIANLLANHKLAKSISDVSWFTFYKFLNYKSQWAGVNLIKIGMFEPTTKRCFICGEINKDLTLKDRHWSCAGCGALLDRDLNAARNIKSIGLKNYYIQGGNHP